MSGIPVRAQVPRAIYHIVLGIALMLAVATLSLVSPSRAYASSALVQDRNAMVTTGTTASLAFSKANTAGNLIVVYVVWDNPGNVTVTDSKGNTYKAATARQAWAGTWSAQVFYASNILAGTNTVKATFGTPVSSFGILYEHEYSGLTTASPVDVSASAAGTSASMSSGAMATTSANDLLFGAGASDNAVTRGTGFTSRLTGFGNLTEDRAVTTTGSYAGTASQNGSNWVMQLVAFRVATGTVSPPAKLAFVQGPSNAAAGVAITPAVKVAVEDANGNVQTSDNSTTVSLAIGTNPSGGTLSGGSAVTVASGVATFSGLSINNAGTGYTLTASSTPSYTAATSAAFNITTAPPPSGWTSYLNGNDHTDFASTESGFNPTSVANLHIQWQTADAGPAHGVYTQPVVSNGLVYWGSFDGFERASSQTTGSLMWQTNLGTTSPPACTDPSSAGIVSTPTITTDVPVGTATSVLYIAGGNSTVYALNAATGAVLWSYSVGNNPNTFLWSSPIVFGNSVYVDVSSFGDCPLVQGEVLQLNRVTGALQNTFDIVPNGCTGGGAWGSPTLDAAAGTIYFATGNPGSCGSTETMAPALIEVRASDLSLVGFWAVPVAQQGDDSDFGSTPTLFNGVIGGQSEPLVGVINKNGVFYALQRDALSAGPVWSTRIATGGGDPPRGSGDVAPAAWDGTNLYVGGDNTSTCTGTVNALNPSTGAFVWQHCFTDGGFVIGAVTVTSGGVVSVGEGSNIALVSAATGASVFTYTGVGPFWGPSSITGGTLYEGDMSGNLYALTVNPTPTIGFVQINSATPQTNQSTVTLPYTKTQGAGDLNVVAIGFNNATSTITSVTDSAGNVYQVAAPLKAGSGMSQAIYYAKNIKASAAGANAVTVQFSNAVPFADVRVAEYGGLDTSNPLDTSASAAGNGSSASSGNLTTSGASDVIVGAGYTATAFTGATNGFISRIITPTDADIVDDELVSAPGSYTATADLSSPGTWVMQAAAFRVG